MNMDSEICHCYHVTLRKLVNYARRERPRHPTQMSECLGAGTGCGGCAPILHSIYALAGESDEVLLRDLVVRRADE